MASMHVSLTVWCWHYYKKTHRYIIGLIEKVPAGDTLVSSCPPAHCLIITLTITYHTSWYCREQHELVLLSRCSTSDSCLTTLLPCGSLLTCAVTHRCASITRDDKFPIRHSCGLLLRYRSVLVSVTNLTEMWLMSSLWWNLNNQGEILQYLNSTIKYQAGVITARAADHEECIPRVVGQSSEKGRANGRSTSCTLIFTLLAINFNMDISFPQVLSHDLYPFFSDSFSHKILCPTFCV